MSFQAYLAALETTTGKTPRALLAEAEMQGFAADTRVAVVAEWFRYDYGVGRGHAMAFFRVLKNGEAISERHLGATGSHRDASNELHLDGRPERDRV
jgi:hypothetical protein